MTPFKPTAETRRALELAAAAFAQSLINAIASATVEELREIASEAMPARRSVASTRPRRSAPASRTDVLAAIVAHLQARPEGARAESLRAELGFEKPVLVRALNDGLATEEIRKTGHLRATTYFAA